MTEVKILVSTNPIELAQKIKLWVNEYDYSLKGPVSIGVNNVGNTVYVATLVKGEVE
jgi:hypothetical protein